MVAVDFEDALRFGHFLIHRLQDLLHVGAQTIFVVHDAAGAFRKTLGQTDFLDLVAQQLLDLRKQILIGFLFRLALFLMGLLLFFRVEVDIAFDDGMQMLALELMDVLHDPFVDRIGHVEDFIALALEGFQLWRIGGRGGAFRRDVVDFLLAFGHAFHVFFERRPLAGFRRRAFEQHQFLDAFAVREVDVDAALQNRAEIRPEFQIAVGRFGLHVGQRVENLLRHVLLDDAHRLRLLKHLTGDVQRQIG